MDYSRNLAEDDGRARTEKFERRLDYRPQSEGGISTLGYYAYLLYAVIYRVILIVDYDTGKFPWNLSALTPPAPPSI